MRGRPVCAPKSPADSVVGDFSPRASRYDSLSTSKLRQTATRALPGHDFGVSFRPTRAGATAWRSCSSDHFVPGWAGGACCAETTAVARTATARINRSLTLFIDRDHDVRAGRARQHQPRPAVAADRFVALA